MRAPVESLTLPASIGPPETNTDGDVEAQRRHQHARRDLVAVRDADERVGAMGVGHVFDAVGDHLARGQRIEHAVVAHGDAVVDRDGVELLGDAARRLDLARDELAEVLEMDVAGHELGEGIGDGDDRLAEVAVLHAGGAPEAAGARPCCGRGWWCGNDMGAWAGLRSRLRPAQGLCADRGHIDEKGRPPPAERLKPHKRRGQSLGFVAKYARIRSHPRLVSGLGAISCNTLWQSYCRTYVYYQYRLSSPEVFGL